MNHARSPRSGLAVAEVPNLRHWRERVEAALDNALQAPTTEPRRLHEAMRYATLGGGKRLRACLVYASGAAVGAPEEALDAPACAVELIQAYSLAHDDLPCMDDDDLRRGKPACHRAFDEATALLVGDALQSRAFGLLARAEQVPAEHRVRMIEALADAIGSAGMAGGQAIDLAATNTNLSPEALADMHARKTGALIRAAVRLGALAAGNAPAPALAALDDYARQIGLGFQIADDILDVEGETAAIGKPRGSDAARGKATYVSMLGLAEARRRAREAHAGALAAIADFGDNSAHLAALADFAIHRQS